MKIITNLKSIVLIILLCFNSNLFAKDITKEFAENVAIRFSKLHNNNAIILNSDAILTNNGNTAFYVVNLSPKGFVLISANDILLPIIGYSFEDNFVEPTTPSQPLFYFLNKRKSEIEFALKNNIAQTSLIEGTWLNYSGVTQNKKSSSATIVVAPFLVTKWNQSPFYNDLCPGGSVTGCVATAMAQIMRYWQYPKTGTGSSSYLSSYGLLSVNYGVATYNYNTMPYVVSSTNNDVALLNYHCGVSVEMGYSPSGSGAWVICQDNPVAAQSSYTNYFGYDSQTILGDYRNNYSDATWHGMIKNDLDIGRPVQYAGFGNAGGHTWILDGYDSDDFYHMDWGWGGSGNGYYSIDDLNPNGTSFDIGQQALFGIVPPATGALDVGINSVSEFVTSCTNNLYAPVISITNYGSTPLTSFTLNYQLDNGTTQSIAWNGNLVNWHSTKLNIPQYVLTNGNHTLTSTVINPNNGNETLLTNNYDTKVFKVMQYTNGGTQNSEGFENGAGSLQNWEPQPTTGANWSITNNSSATGANAIVVNNFLSQSTNSMILMSTKLYNTSLMGSALLSFKVAYQQKNTSSNDKLQLQISTDCGKTWYNKWVKQGAALATNTNISNSAFNAQTVDYVEYTSLTARNNTVLFRFVFTPDANGNSNNIFLDDINIFDSRSSVGIQNNVAEAGFSIVPNPVSNHVFTINNLESGNNTIFITDITGKTVYSESVTSSATATINLPSTITKGIYLVKLISDNSVLTQKLVVGD